MRGHRPFAALVATVAVAFALAGCGSSGPYAARVDGQSISQDALENELRAIASNDRYLSSVEQQVAVRGLGQGTFDATFTARVLTNQIRYALVEAELARRKLDVPATGLVSARPSVVAQAGGDDIFEAFPKDYQDALVRRAAEVNVLTVALAGQLSVSEAAKVYYDGHTDQFAQACVSHILVDSSATASQVKARLDAGEDFAAVARATSRDAASAAKGGDLGCGITRDTPFVPEFLAAVFAQPVGAAGPGVQSSFGVHIIKVVSRTVPPFESVAVEAEGKVVAEGQPKLATWLAEAVEQAKIDVNPRYGTFAKSGASSAVIAPQAPTTRSGTP